MTTCQILFSTNNGTLHALFNDSDDGLKILSCNTFFKNKKLPTYQTFNILLLLFSKKVVPRLVLSKQYSRLNIRPYVTLFFWPKWVSPSLLLSFFCRNRPHYGYKKGIAGIKKSLFLPLQKQSDIST